MLSPAGLLFLASLITDSPSSTLPGVHEPSTTQAPRPVYAIPELDSIRINEYVSYDPRRRLVHLTLVGGHEGLNGGMNFNGAERGGATLTVPLGWQVQVAFRNRDAALPHSVIVVPVVRPIPVVPGEPAFVGAVSSQPMDGLAEGEESRFAFSASRAGEFLILCAVPGHGTAGMWIALAISATADRPAYQ